ncbi:hypothetical protein J6590_040539 [Homalodisca vitripennis]|nr:hypothetical protein J6590_040539 [Homalodisca vitripennis]
MNDNACPHSAAVVSGYLREVGIKISGVANKKSGPKPNRICVGQYKELCQSQKSTFRELCEAVKEEWERMPIEVIQHLVEGHIRSHPIPRRFQARGETPVANQKLSYLC